MLRKATCTTTTSLKKPSVAVFYTQPEATVRPTPLSLGGPGPKPAVSELEDGNLILRCLRMLECLFTMPCSDLELSEN